MANQKKYLTLTLLFFIVLFGGALRLFRIDKAPDSLSWDEAALGYNAYSLYKTGRDEYAIPLPVSLRSFDDYKPAVYSYLTVPFFLVSPPNDIVVRLPSAIFGTLLIFLIFILVYTLTESRKFSLLTALLLATAAWGIHFSRMAFETNIASCLLYLGLIVILRSLKKGNSFWLGTVCVALSMYTYHAPRVTALPLAVCIVILFSQRRLRDLFSFSKLFFLLLIPLAINFTTAPITARLTGTNIFKLWPFVPKEFSLIIYNPFYALIWNYAGRFFSYFSPINLFVKGSTEFNLFTPTLGLFSTWEMPFWLLGWSCLLLRRQLRKFVIPIMLIAPLPGVITWNWFSTVRTTTLYPIFSILTAYGLLRLWTSRFKLLTLPVILIALLSTLYLVTTEEIYSPAVTFGQNPPGYEQAAPYIMSIADQYKHIVIDSSQSSPHIMMLVYSQYDPLLYQQQGGVYRTEKYDGINNYGFSKFEFRKIDWPNDKHLTDTLFMGPVPRLPDYEFATDPDYVILKDIHDLQGYISFRIVARRPGH